MTELPPPLPPDPWAKPALGYGPPPPPPPGYGAFEQPWQPQHPQQPTGPQQGTDGFAVAALVLGIIPVFVGVLGIVFGFIARSRIKRTGQGGAGMALAGIILGFTWVVGLVGLITLGLVFGSVEYHSSSRSTAAGALRIGDCVSTLPSGTVFDVSRADCDEPHVGEVFDTYVLEDGTFPGTEASKSLVLNHCRALLPAYVGAPAGRTGYAIAYIYPTATSWLRNDRVGVCLLQDPDELPLLGSAQGEGPIGPSTRA